ncbi:periplasmic solute binding protein [Jonesia denitrificans DSM 20603]|uniref:Periplasmic solute binding protein n=1 Tax=Jonesia denitrificans (strain ATCC 14870 / DSM 20603 / BCRC 15368 / CIP 55.134 / JCM 11481 / NBRC 15587 / NCTC 10816 / Prevot 55134) TaxID=471856 RepID=C7QZ61_JONDD|nr:periplasmic solute binding protein [Jonesia denitrificans DSM 20603]ASE08339.1 metal ABC transporter substrate-binding protein [Jonesia denitrificans]SQH19945.1 Uncharacterized periplasmic iron-binding protein HI_0362 precursor [Jonesia denitrificans]
MKSYRPAKTLLSVIVIVLLSSGCTGSSTQPVHQQTAPEQGQEATPDIRVTTTFTITADMVAAIGGEHVTVTSLTPPGADIHSYEPTPTDIVTAQHSDLIVEHGLGLDSWLSTMTNSVSSARITVTEGITPIPIAAGEYEGVPNPHAWLSAENAHIYIANIVRVLSDIAPEHAAEFAERGRAYSDRIDTRFEQIRELTETIPPENRTVVTCEGAFSYLTAELGFTEAWLWPVNAEREATPRRVAAVIDTVRDQGVPTVFCESTVGDKPMRLVTEDTGASFGGVLYVDSLTDAAGPAPTYLDLLSYNATVITQGLATS